MLYEKKTPSLGQFAPKFAVVSRVLPTEKYEGQTIGCLPSLCSSRFLFFSRRRGDRTSERKADERRSAPGVSTPPPPTAYFRTLSKFSSRSRAFGKGKETAATQANVFLGFKCSSVGYFESQQVPIPDNLHLRMSKYIEN